MGMSVEAVRELLGFVVVDEAPAPEARPTLEDVRALILEAGLELEAFEVDAPACEQADEERAEYFRREALGLSYIREGVEGWY